MHYEKEGYISVIKKKNVFVNRLLSKAVHGSVYDGFVPNPKPTCQIQVIEKLTYRQLPESTSQVEFSSG